MSNPQVLAIIPARGGSKGVPGKNIKPLAGRPLIAYAIDNARQSKYIQRVIVSTDDPAIAETAQGLGAEVPFLRPTELASDTATDLPVFQHALGFLAQREGYRPEMVAHLRPTAPLRTATHVDAGIELLMANPEADAVRSVCPAPKHPCKMWKFTEGRLEPFLPASICGPEAYNLGRQQLPPAYIQNGSVDITRWRTVMEMNSMTGKRILGLLMAEHESVNIDTLLDFQLAETLLQNRGR